MAWGEMLLTGNGISAYRLKSQYRCIAIDLPGYGGSTVVNRAEALAQLDFYAEKIAAMLRKLKMNKAMVMGIQWVARSQ